MYDGQWFNGKQHGEGVFTTSKGETRRGVWVRGVRSKWLDKTQQKIDEECRKQNPTKPVWKGEKCRKQNTTKPVWKGEI